MTAAITCTAPALVVARAPCRHARTCRQPQRKPLCKSTAESLDNVEQQRPQQIGSAPASRRQLLGAAAALSTLLSLQQSAALAADSTLPKGYLDTARKLVDALREAISTDLSDAEEREVRRAADPAKSLVREFLTRWRGNPAVERDASYAALTSAIQQLGAFYQANGQRARLTPEAGQAVLDSLDAAQAALPEAQQLRSLLPF